MTPTNNLNEKAIFNVARAITSLEARSEYLQQVCGDDEAMVGRVKSLLEGLEKQESFLELPAVPSPTVDIPSIAVKPGTQIGPYKLLQQLGEGGMGVVYLAERQHPVKQRVALKIIKQGMDSKKFIARFEAERQALAMMDHPNIAKVLDAGCTDNGRPYFVMELVKGVAISTFCDENRLTTRGRLELFIQVCQAVHHAHQKGIIHRDLKPTNVLVAMYDDKPIPKVIDFGVAKATNQQLTERTLFTEVGTILGTWEYMSPEQAVLNQLDVDIRSDVYSLGVVLYELLTGETPLDRKRLRDVQLLETFRMIREEEPPKPSTRISNLGDRTATAAAYRGANPSGLASEIRGDLDWIVMKSLDKQRARRYDSASRFAGDIQRFMNHELVEARPPSTWYRVQKTWRRNRLFFTSATALGAILLIALSVFLVSYSKYRTIVGSLHDELVARVINQAANGEVDDALLAIEQLTSIGASERLTATLEGIAYAVAGESHRAIDSLEELADVPENALAKKALVRAYYDAGELTKFEKSFDGLKSVDVNRVDSVEADLERVYSARNIAYAPGNGDEEAIDLLDGVLQRNRLWGIGYFARAEAYLTKFQKSKSLADLEKAFYDDHMARVLLPKSTVASSYSLKLHVNSLRYAEAFPGTMDASIVEQRRSRASELAAEFCETLSRWDGAAHALAYYRFTQQHSTANELEERIEAKFSDVQTIRDGRRFVKRDIEGFRSDVNSSSNPYSRQMYALLLYENGQREDAISEVKKAIDEWKGNVDSLLHAVNVIDVMGEAEVRREAIEELQAPATWDIWWWHVELAQFVCGDMTESDEEALLERACPFSEMLATAHFHIGSARLARGDRKSAREHFLKVLQTGRIGWGAYFRAKVYLNRMDEDDKWPR